MIKFRQILIAFDSLANTLLAGMADETISARAYRSGVIDGNPKRRWKYARQVIDLLFFWQNEHCKEAYLSEFQRKQLPVHYRTEPMPDDGKSLDSIN